MDDLTTLKGVGKATATRLVAAGITSFESLAAATPEQFQAIDKLGGKPDEWADWVSQAKALAPLALETASSSEIDEHAARIDAARTAIQAAGDAAVVAQASGDAQAIETARVAVVEAEAALDALIGPGTSTETASQNSTDNPQSEAEEGEAGDLATGLPGIQFQLAETFAGAVAALDDKVFELLEDEGAESASQYLAERLADLDDATAHMSNMRGEILRLQITVSRTESVWPLETIRFDGAEQPVGVELKVDHDTFLALTASGAAADRPPDADTEEA